MKNTRRKRKFISPTQLLMVLAVIFVLSTISTLTFLCINDLNYGAYFALSFLIAATSFITAMILMAAYILFNFVLVD